MEHFDILVIGSGSGMIIASAAIEQGFRVALLESGVMGGTCLNRGCVPSKILLYPAEAIRVAKEIEKLGVKITVDTVDFKKIMDRTRSIVNTDSNNQAKAVEATPEITWFKETGHFVSDYTLQSGEHTMRADKIFIVSGSRPEIPPIKGIEKVNYLTSDSVLELDVQPKSILIVGGGYVGAEYGHFFSSLGTKVTVLQRSARIIPEEEPEISEILKNELSQRMDVFTGLEVVEAKEDSINNVKIVVARSNVDGSLREFSAEALMIATGRAPNSDLLKPENTGVKLDERGFIKVNEYLETGKKNIWALGDAIGKEMFKHVANHEASIAWHNAMHDHRVAMDYSVAPHAVFTHPQVASVGLLEAEARQRGLRILVGKATYKGTAMGAAMGEPAGFVKVIVERSSGKILGAHIIGPQASVLIQEIINVMVTETRSFAPVAQAMHIHPALSEVVQNAFGDLTQA